MPIVGSKVKFQPCYVGDIGDAVTAIIKDSIKQDFYELGGPRQYTLENLIGIMLKEIRRSNMILPMPYGLSKLQAFFLQLAPKPLLTIDQVKILESGDNIITNKYKTFIDLKINPRSVESIMPSYLTVYRPAGQFTK